MKLSSVKVDSARVQEGEWIGDLPEMGDLQVKVRGINNADYRLLQRKLINAVPLKRRRRGLQQEDEDRIVGECLLKTVLQDWHHLESDDGQTIAYDADFAAQLLNDPDYRAFRDAVVYAATLVGGEKEDIEEEMEKNSSQFSATS